MNIEQLLRFALQRVIAAKYARITVPKGQTFEYSGVRNIAEDACDIEGLTLHLHYRVTKKPNPFRPYYIAELRHVTVPGLIEMPESFGVECGSEDLADIIPGIDIDYTKSESINITPFIPE